MRILFLSDTVINANTGGISQTLYNIFSFIEPENILCITSKRELKILPADKKFADRYITYDFEVLYLRGNRFSKYINPFIQWFNYSFNSVFRKFRKIKGHIDTFDPDVVISCPNGAVGVIMHNKILDGYSKKVFPYFMDDWMYQMQLKWVNGDINKSIKKILSDNAYWIMISENLADILSIRYGVTPKGVLELHNPVDLSDAPIVNTLKKKQEYTFAYAGALWPMHFDSFLLVAKGVFQLNKTRKVNLILYTSQTFWDWRKNELEPLGVIYGGSIPYFQIHQKLSEADALILVSSFLKDYYTHSKGSLQTKITDYLKARRLIVSCGPEYSANHSFLKKNNCGVFIETNNQDSAVLQLNEVLDNIEHYQKMVENGWAVLEKEFTFSIVHEKLRQFITISKN